MRRRRPQNNQMGALSTKDNKLLSLWYVSLGLGIAATVVSLYSLYRYHQNNT